MDAAKDFLARLDVLVRDAGYRVERPRGTEHPRLPGVIYPVDYGHLAGTTSGDGDGVDVVRGTAATGVVAVALTADLVKRDVEMKLLVGCTAREIAAVERFLGQVLGIGGLIVPRTGGPQGIEPRTRGQVDGYEGSSMRTAAGSRRSSAR